MNFKELSLLAKREKVKLDSVLDIHTMKKVSRG